jgi:hypothetical protein
MGFTAVVTAASAAVSAYGAISKGSADAQQAQYQAGVAQINAQIAKQNADYAVASGEVEAKRSDMASRFKQGETVAQQGAGGLAVGSGSNARGVQSEKEVGVQDAALIRSNAAKRAYGYEVGAAQDTSQAAMFQTAASNDKTSGYISAAGSLLSSGGSVASKWMQASQAGMLDTGDGTTMGGKVGSF